MRSTQPHPVGNDLKASVVQQNLQELFELAHEHTIRSTEPAENDGEPRDIVIVDDGTDVFLYIKTTRGWFRTSALTAI